MAGGKDSKMPMHYCGYLVAVESNPSPTAIAAKHGQSASSSQKVTTSVVDKSTSSYARATVTQSASSGVVFNERGSSGRVGFKDEYKTTSTYKVGNRSGYSEYQVEERFRNVTYQNNTNSNKKYLN